MTDSPVFFLDDCLIEPSSLTVSRGSTKEKLQPRVMRILLELCEQDGKTVSRSDLIEVAWGSDCHVSDEALTKAISILRKKLCQCGVDAGVIETVPKIGYRLTVAATHAGSRHLNVEHKAYATEPGPHVSSRFYQIVAALLLLVTGALSTALLVNREPDLAVRVQRQFIASPGDTVVANLALPVDTLLTNENALTFLSNLNLDGQKADIRVTKR